MHCVLLLREVLAYSLNFHALRKWPPRRVNPLAIGVASTPLLSMLHKENVGMSKTEYHIHKGVFRWFCSIS